MEPIVIFLGILIIIALILYAIAIYDLIINKSQFKNVRIRGLWLFIIVMFPGIGSLTYLLFKGSFAK